MPTEYQKCGLTEHEMKCVGLGLAITERLTYRVEYRNERFIGTETVFYSVRSRQEAVDVFKFDRPGNLIVSVELL